MKKKKLALGSSDFRRIIEEDRYYVDKSLLIQEIIDSSDTTTLIPRPRRFGKTLNLNMLKCFFQNNDFLNDKYDPAKLFENLKIWKAGDEYVEKCGKYPVIYLTFKDVKNRKWEECYNKTIDLISSEFKRHDYVLDGNLREDDRDYYQRIINRTAAKEEFESSIKKLSQFLYNHHGRKTVVLIDEYDMPIQAGYLYNYYEEIVEFMRNFLSGGMKDNEFLERAVMTGILRVAKESIFSGLNNVGVASILSPKHQDKFGFTEDEVIEILDYYEKPYDIKEIRAWYNGYVFGDTYIYNPWSILEFIDHGFIFKTWWANTSSNDMIKDLITTADPVVKMELKDLLEGKSIVENVTDNIVYRDIDSSSETLWNFMLFSGYLKLIRTNIIEGSEKWEAELVIPNREVRSVFTETITNWFKENIPNDTIYLRKSLLEGDVRTFHKILLNFAKKTFSYFDVKGTEPEKFYHGFVLGMIAHLSDVFEIKSNRESGYGRYDVMLIPRDKTNFGIIFEFKKVEPDLNETLEQAIEEAKEQIKEKNYRAELENAGVKNILEIAIAFEGKKIMLQSD